MAASPRTATTSKAAVVAATAAACVIVVALSPTTRIDHSLAAAPLRSAHWSPVAAGARSSCRAHFPAIHAAWSLGGPRMAQGLLPLVMDGNLPRTSQAHRRSGFQFGRHNVLGRSVLVKAGLEDLTTADLEVEGQSVQKVEGMKETMIAEGDCSSWFAEYQMVESFQLESIKIDPKAKELTKAFRDRVSADGETILKISEKGKLQVICRVLVAE